MNDEMRKMLETMNAEQNARNVFVNITPADILARIEQEKRRAASA